MQFLVCSKLCRELPAIVSCCYGTSYSFLDNYASANKCMLVCSQLPWISLLFDAIGFGGKLHGKGHGAAAGNRQLAEPRRKARKRSIVELANGNRFDFDAALWFSSAQRVCYQRFYQPRVDLGN